MASRIEWALWPLAIGYYSALTLLLSGLAAYAGLGIALFLSNLPSALRRFLSGIFAIFSVLLIFYGLLEAASLYFFGLHANFFLWKAFLWGDSPFLWRLGVMVALITAALFIFIQVKKWRGLTLLGSEKYRAGRLMLGIMIALGVEAFYIQAYTAGRFEILTLKRQLPGFISPHPWHIRQIAAWITDEPVDSERNPFAKTQTPASSVQGGAAVPRQELAQGPAQGASVSAQGAKEPLPNILILISDSWRALDISKNPSLMPRFFNLAQKGQLDLQHIASANCTHFSFYSLFSGELATHFSKARQQQKLTPLLKKLSQLGYHFSSSEAESLDWYDISTSLWGGQIDRSIAPQGSMAMRDDFVTQNSLERIQVQLAQESATAKALPEISLAVKTSPPIFHLAYYNGTHFPYGADFAHLKNPQKAYETALLRLDSQIAALLQSLEGRKNWRVIITSDHGEDLEALPYGHGGPILSDAQMTIPLLFLNFNKVWPHDRDHLSLMPFLLAEIGAPLLKKESENPKIIASCGYTAPEAFTLLQHGERFDFDYSGAYLSPLSPLSPAGLQTGQWLLEQLQN